VNNETIAEMAARTPVSELLPARFASEGTPLPETLNVRAATQLSPSTYLLVAQAPEIQQTGAPQAFVVPAVVEEGRLRRAIPGDGAADALVARLSRAEPTAFPGFECQRFHQVAPTSSATESPVGERSLPVDQTHESVVVGEVAVVKWQVSATPTPTPTIVAHLAANKFAQMPTPWGFVSWHVGDADVLLASVTEFLPGATDGWEWMVADLAEFATGSISLSVAAAPAAEIGSLVAELHGALAASSEVIQSPRQLATALERQLWFERAETSLVDALSHVQGEAVELLERRREAIEESFEAIRGSSGTTVIPVHGDLHVGQVLRWGGGYAVNDFDGNPVLSVQERMAPAPAARDVAGMLQSLDHVGRVVLRRRTDAKPSRVIDWIAESQQSFLDSYRAHLRGRGMVDLLDDSLLFPFQVEQECREFIYAHRHLPRWGYVPAGAIRALLP